MSDQMALHATDSSNRRVVDPESREPQGPVFDSDPKPERLVVATTQVSIQPRVYSLPFRLPYVEASVLVPNCVQTGKPAAVYVP